MSNNIQDEADAFNFPTENGWLDTDRCCNNCRYSVYFYLTEEKDRWHFNKRSANINIYMKSRICFP